MKVRLITGNRLPRKLNGLIGEFKRINKAGNIVVEVEIEDKFEKM